MPRIEAERKPLDVIILGLTKSTPVAIVSDMDKHTILIEQERLTALYNAARAKAQADNTIEARDAAVAASRELSAFIAKYNPPKAHRGRDNTAAARSGRRQHAEMRSRYWGR